MNLLTEIQSAQKAAGVPLDVNGSTHTPHINKVRRAMTAEARDAWDDMVLPDYILTCLHLSTIQATAQACGLTLPDPV